MKNVCCSGCFNGVNLWSDVSSRVSLQPSLVYECGGNVERRIGVKIKTTIAPKRVTLSFVAKCDVLIVWLDLSQRYSGAYGENVVEQTIR